MPPSWQQPWLNMSAIVVTLRSHQDVVRLQMQQLKYSKVFSYFFAKSHNPAQKYVRHGRAMFLSLPIPSSLKICGVRTGLQLACINCHSLVAHLLGNFKTHAVYIENGPDNKSLLHGKDVPVGVYRCKHDAVLLPGAVLSTTRMSSSSRSAPACSIEA